MIVNGHKVNLLLQGEINKCLKYLPYAKKLLMSLSFTMNQIGQKIMQCTRQLDGVLIKVSIEDTIQKIYINAGGLIWFYNLATILEGTYKHQYLATSGKDVTKLESVWKYDVNGGAYEQSEDNNKIVRIKNGLVVYDYDAINDRVIVKKGTDGALGSNNALVINTSGFIISLTYNDYFILIDTSGSYPGSYYVTWKKYSYKGVLLEQGDINYTDIMNTFPLRVYMVQGHNGEYYFGYLENDTDPNKIYLHLQKRKFSDVGYTLDFEPVVAVDSSWLAEPTLWSYIIDDIINTDLQVYEDVVFVPTGFPQYTLDGMSISGTYDIRYIMSVFDNTTGLLINQNTDSNLSRIAFMPDVKLTSGTATGTIHGQSMPHVVNDPESGGLQHHTYTLNVFELNLTDYEFSVKETLFNGPNEAVTLPYRLLHDYTNKLIYYRQ